MKPPPNDKASKRFLDLKGDFEFPSCPTTERPKVLGTNKGEVELEVF